MNENELAQFAAWLRRKHIPIKIEWLKTCVEYLDQNLGRKLSLSEETFNLVIQQFLHSKLSEALNPIMKIPMNAVKVIIVKRMVFEMTSCTSNSISQYEQLSELTLHNDNLSWFHGGSKIISDENSREKEEDTIFDQRENNNKQTASKKRGMLKLDLNDGLNTVKAIEIEEVFEEELLVPGVKLILTGRVKCRRGILFLEKSNCSLIGGRIESLKFDKIKQLSDALKLDLNAEKKRRQDSVAKASALKSRKKNASSLNQSSISPFLIKIDRKTGKVDNTSTRVPHQPEEPEPLSSHCRQKNWEDFSIEEVREQASEATINSSNNLEILPTESSITRQASKHPRKTENENNMTEDWEFSSTSALEKAKTLKFPIILENNSLLKQLPGQLLRAELSSKNQIINRPTLGSPSMAADKRKDISEWIWDERKGSEEEEVLTKRKTDDSVVEIPQCFVKSVNPKFELLRADDRFEVRKPRLSAFSQTLHGPRKRIEDYRVNQKNNEAKTLTFPTVKETRTISNHIERTPVEAEIDVEQFTQSVPEEMDYNNGPDEKNYIEPNEEDVGHYVEIDETVPGVPYSQSLYQKLSNEEREFLDDEKDLNDSIMECTIEQEGRLECERWGLRKQAPGEANKSQPCHSYGVKNIVDNDAVMARIFSLSPQIHFSSIEEEINEISGGEYSNECSHPSKMYACPTQTISSQNQNWAFGYPTTFSPRNMKTETVDNSEERRMMPLTRIPKIKCYPDREEEIKNKQSENVQVYKTPFAKRLNSTDSSTTTTSELFKRMSDLQIVPFAEALINRKFWMMSKIIVVMPTICRQLHELKSDGIDWLLQISVTDTSTANIKCRVATVLLNRVFGFNVQQCKNLFNSNQVAELRSKKFEAERKLLGFKRLDLLLWIEVSPEPEKLPLIVDVKTISDALNVL